MNQTATLNAATALSAHVDRLLHEHFGSRDGQLLLAGVTVGDLIETYGSPLYVYDRSVMKRQLTKVRRAYSDRVDVYYSMKANPSQQVLQYFLSEGCGIEIASVGELEQAIAAGCQPERILFAGPGKQDEELQRAVALGIGEIHVESAAEAGRLNAIAQQSDKLVRISLRINPAESAQGGAMRMGGKPSPFGIDEESLDDVLSEILTFANLDIRGVHLFTGTQILDHNILITQYRKAIEIAERVSQRITGTLESIDFGGGLGIPYFERESPL
ncbi:MAG: type III PLP-dependent enzyme, partial [Fuerstiella sp.]|nr:type III PLP-dependent enzyme [Fuerstiella sp.]